MEAKAQSCEYEIIDERKRKGKEKKPTLVPFTQLFRFADKTDKILIISAVVASVLHGATFPLQFILFGTIIDKLINFENRLSTPDILESAMTDLALFYVYLAIGTLIASYLQTALFSWSATRQTKKMRTAFFEAVMRQDIEWFDTYVGGELNTRLTDDIDKVNEGIGRKVGVTIQFLVAFLVCYGIGFSYSWKLTLVMSSLVPLLIVAGRAVGKVVSVLTTKELDAYAKAGAIAEEVLSSIKTVVAFGGEEKETKRYSANLHEAQAYGIKKGLSMGLGFGFLQLIMFSSYALAFWYGCTLVLDGELSGGRVLLVFFAVLTGATQLGQAGPHVEAISTARGAAYEILKIIDREPPIDVSSEEGEKPTNVSGSIEFKNVHFSYPSREDVKVLNGLNLEINAGQTVALVGESGCGKSTTIKLIKRFYDPQSGSILLDNQDTRKLNLSWLRRFIGVVSQEPVLFATTIAENIRYGQDGISQEDIEKATKMSNAHDFIQKLPNGYDTFVGERGAQLSGGQKQRIAIARALVRNPKILLLDEATSALDTESESLVQTALDKAREGRTTIIIAHRLSTVRKADAIAAFENGVIVELGSHSELMAHDGVYKQLIDLQTFVDVQTDEPFGHGKLSVDVGLPDEELKDEPEKKDSGTDDNDNESQILITTVHSNNNQVEKENNSSSQEENAAPITRILKLNTQEWPYIVVGVIAAIGNGAFSVLFALLLGQIVNVFTMVENPQLFKEQSLLWSLLFLAFGGFSCLARLLQNYMFAKSGELLTTRLRQMLFKSLLNQEMAFFDDPHHSTGALTTALATHASGVKGAAGARLGTITMSITTIVTSLVYSFMNGWKLTLVVLAFSPFIILSGLLPIKMQEGSKKRSAIVDAGKISVEAFENIQTIASLGIEQKFCHHFNTQLEAPYRRAVRSAHLYGLCCGFTEAVNFCNIAASFRFGAFLMVSGEMNMMEVIKVVLCIIIAGMAFGQMTALSPDYAKAKLAAARIFKLFDRVSLIDSSSTEGTIPSTVEGTIKLNDIQFSYPTRQDVKVLHGLDLSVKTGQTLALVGSSGCGKSTVVSLLERFYDVESGKVALDGHNVRNLNIKWLRSKLSIVSQEPVLFGFSIAENIAYGDNSREVSRSEIEAAAQSANIHSFINSLPKGYDTLVGDKGTLISGGQKQRIAIARALIRNPQILLLDEATSALDTESERAVQDALDAASKGRTVIMIAHRLSTVKNADMIAVIHHGQVVEQGTHQELLAMDGYYTGLVSAQMINEEN